MPGPSGARETITARGAYLLPTSASQRTFDLAVELDSGAATKLSTREQISESGDYEIVVTQRGRALFDGLDNLDVLTDRELAFALLQNAARFVDVELRRPN